MPVPAESMKDMVGFGALNVDLIYEVDDLGLLKRQGVRVEPGGETYGSLEEFEPVLEWLERTGRLQSRSGGGQAANTMVALARMGFEVGYVGKVGDDTSGDFLIEGLAPADTDRIRRGGRSGLCLVLLGQSGESSNLVLPNCNDTLSYEEIDLDYIRGFRFLHLTSFVGQVPFTAQKLIAQEVSPQVKLSFDPGELYARKGLKELLPILERSFIVFVTQREVELLTGRGHRYGSEQILDHGPAVVVCKRGEAGSYVLSSREGFEVPADRVEVVDTTGAGDVYAAGFLAGLLKGRPLWDCAGLASRVASRSTTGYGRERYPDGRSLRELGLGGQNGL